ncbi:PD-(D/E)XK nuclease family protein [Humidisolicoccus flavus]|uniref:PD-(D/E)XK nuclease family protein n=1 Tax=Humidisolicoccus flavus TaxID=3111414 RepID=UPI00324F63CA
MGTEHAEHEGTGTLPRGFAPDPSQESVLALAPGSSAVVFGAPGTGKTALLAEIVARRFDEGWSSDSIMVIAGSRLAANRLRMTLAHLVERVTLGPLARSMPSFAFQVLSDAARRQGAPRPRLLSGADQDAIIAELLAGHRETKRGPSWPAVFHEEVRELSGFRTELREFLARVTEFGLGPEQLRALSAQAHKPEWAAIAEFAREYDDVLALQHRDDAVPYDAAGLLAAAAREIETGGLGNLRLLIVDDAQELTEGAARIIAAVHAQGGQVLLFGDPDTTTGIFHGAVPTLMAELQQRLALGAPHVLNLVHRHSSGIRQVVARTSNAIGAALAGPQRGALAGEEGGQAFSLLAENSPEETANIANVLRERHVLGGVPWDQLAVVARSSGIVRGLSEALAALEVPTSATGAREPRQVPIVRDLMLVMRLASDRGTLTAEHAEQLLLGPLGGLDAIDVRRLRAALRQRALRDDDARSADEFLVEALAEPVSLLGFPGRVAKRVLALGESLGKARSEIFGLDSHEGDLATAEEVLWGIWSRAGLAESWKAEALAPGVASSDAHRRLDAVLALFAAAQRYSEREPDRTAADFVDAWDAAAIVEDSIAPIAQSQLVTVGTPSMLLGREFDTVVVASVQEGVWPNLKVRGSLFAVSEFRAIVKGGEAPNSGEPGAFLSTLHDELRLFTQATSRAKNLLFVSAVQSEEELPSKLAEGLPQYEPSVPAEAMSLRGLVGALRRDLFETGDSDAAAALAELTRASVPGASPAEWLGVRDISTSEALHTPTAENPVRVSPSSIEKFTACPLHWFVETLDVGSHSIPASIGTIVHAAVESAEDFSEASLLSAIDARWNELGFTTTWGALREHRVVEQLVTRLSAYLLRITEGGWQIRDDEHELRFTHSTGNAVLSGSIDWIERRDDEARIVDLKTGQAISLAEVAEHAQLRAYQWAAARGGIPTLDASGNVSARLVFPKKTTRAIEMDQQPMTNEDLLAFEGIIAETASGMSGETFPAHPGTHCGASHFGRTSCSLHLVREVTE